eukprot:144855-Rhodomonas_salina.3
MAVMTVEKNKKGKRGREEGDLLVLFGDALEEVQELLRPAQCRAFNMCSHVIIRAVTLWPSFEL